VERKGGKLYDATHCHIVAPNDRGVALCTTLS